MAKARMQLTRNGVQNADAVFEFIWAKKRAWSSTCKHGWSQVKYRETRCETISSLSVTLVHGFAGTCNGLSRPFSTVCDSCCGHKAKIASSALAKPVVTSELPPLRLYSGFSRAAIIESTAGLFWMKSSNSSTLAGFWRNPCRTSSRMER